MSNELEAIAKLKRRDIAGLELLVELYQARAVHAAYLIIGDAELAKDIVQTAFLNAFESIDTFDSERPFGPWFLKSVVNRAITALSRTKRFVPLDEDHETLAVLKDLLQQNTTNPEHIRAKNEIREAVWRALAMLPSAQRSAIVLYYYLGFSETEIADDLGCAPGTIKWRLHIARKKMRGLLKPIINWS